MDAAGPALPLEPLLVGLAVISGISRGLGGGPVTRDDIPEPPRPSKRSAPVALPLRMKPKARRIEMLFL